MAYGWKVTNKNIISFDDNGGKKMSLQECRRQCFEDRDCLSFQAKCDVDLTVKILSMSSSKYQIKTIVYFITFRLTQYEFSDT